jgi:hypothetical protein
VLLWPQRGAVSRLQGAKRTGEEHKRVVDGRGAHVVDAADDDPVIAGGVFGVDLTFERGERVGE